VRRGEYSGPGETTIQSLPAQRSLPCPSYPVPCRAGHVR
jgi:hypothetical protein